MLRIAKNLDAVGVPDMQADLDRGYRAIVRHLTIVAEKAAQTQCNLGAMEYAYAALKDWYGAALDDGVDVTNEAEALLQTIAAQSETAVRAEDRAAGVNAAVDLVEFDPNNRSYRRQVRQLANRQLFTELFRQTETTSRGSLECQASRRIGRYGLFGYVNAYGEMMQIRAAYPFEEDRFS